MKFSSIVPAIVAGLLLAGCQGGGSPATTTSPGLIPNATAPAGALSASADPTAPAPATVAVTTDASARTAEKRPFTTVWTLTQTGGYERTANPIGAFTIGVGVSRTDAPHKAPVYAGNIFLVTGGFNALPPVGPFGLNAPTIAVDSMEIDADGAHIVSKPFLPVTQQTALILHLDVSTHPEQGADRIVVSLAAPPHTILLSIGEHVLPLGPGSKTDITGRIDW